MQYQISVIEIGTDEVIDTVIGDMKVAHKIKNAYVNQDFYRVEIIDFGSLVLA